MSIDLNELAAIYFEEADEHLATIENTLLALEQRPDDRELLNQIFRAAHSIKGGSGTIGLSDVLRFTHELETLLQQLREGSKVLTPALADLLLRAKDVLAALLASARHQTRSPALDAFEPVLAELAAACGSRPEAAAAEEEAPAAAVWRVTFAPSPELMRKGMDPLLVVRDLAALGAVRSLVADTSALPELDELDPEVCHVVWTLEIETSASERDVRDVFAFVEDSSRVEIAPVARDEGAGAPEERAEDAPAVAEAAAPIAQGAARLAGSGGRPKAHSTVRVDTDKIDKLVNLVGELVIAQAMVSSALGDGSEGGVQRLREAMASLERNTRELQDRVMAIRMVPLRTVFDRFPRLVHDTASQLAKEIDLVVEGEDTELDKGVVEKLVDPLTHLVRNSLDHGVETPEARREAGKSSRGTITIRASHQGGNVVIEVIDDGRGLQTEKIRDKARKLGLIAPDAEPSPEEIHALIFAPGFSTAEVVSDVSGRGVGMDVVKRNVEALNGNLAFTSERGKGSRMRIRLPLTLAIMDGLSLRVGEQVFVLPLAAIFESFRPTREQVRSVLGRGEVIHVRGEALPLVRLHDVLGVEGAETDPTRALVCVVEAGAERVGLLVDDLLGQAQVVVKSLEANYRRVDGVMGATILGDGRVALILDVPTIARRNTPKEHFHDPVEHAA